MSQTYCGKSCESCGMRGEMGCPGCAGVGQACDLARCCQEKGHVSCDSCTHQLQCEKYQSRDQAHQLRRERQAAQQQAREQGKQRFNFLSQRMKVLFWALICANVVSLAAEWLFQSAVVGKSIEIICLATYALTLMQMAPACSTYRKAGMLLLVGTFLDIPLMFQENVLSASVISVISMVICIVSYYYEFMAHREVLHGVNEKLSQQWKHLWVWLISFQCVAILGILLTILVVGVVIVMVSGIAILILAIVQLVLLYRTAQAFRQVAQQA